MITGSETVRAPLGQASTGYYLHRRVLMARIKPTVKMRVGRAARKAAQIMDERHNAM